MTGFPSDGKWRGYTGGMDKDSTSRFLNAFASLERHLRKTYGSGKGHDDIPMLLARAQGSGAMRGYAEDLRAFTQLRNVLVHERIENRFLLTTDEAVTRHLEHIVQHLTRPPEIGFFQGEVTTTTAEAHIGEALTVMSSLDLSQLPVYRNGVFISVLTSDTIARWLGANVKDELADLTVPVSEVLKYQESVEKHAFIARNASVFEVLDAFERYTRQGERLSALLITQRGRETEKLLGIITVYDLPRALQAVGQ